MSFAAEEWAYQQNCGGGIAKAVLSYLAFRAGRHNRQAFPSIKTMVEELEHCEEAVRKALRQLADRGLLDRMRRYAQNGRCISTLYRLPVAAASDEHQAPAPTPPNSGDTPPAPTPQISGDLEPSSKNLTGEEEESARADAHAPPFSPSSDEFLVEGKPASRIEEEPTAAPEDPEVEPEMRQLAIERGFDPAEVPEELQEVQSGRRQVPANWQPSTADRACALAHGQDPDLLRDRFVRHYRAKGAKLASFSDQYQLWCLPDPRYPRRQTLDEKIAGTHDHYAAMAQRLGMLSSSGLTMGGQP